MSEFPYYVRDKYFSRSIGIHKTVGEFMYPIGAEHEALSVLYLILVNYFFEFY